MEFWAHEKVCHGSRREKNRKDEKRTILCHDLNGLYAVSLHRLCFATKKKNRWSSCFFQEKGISGGIVIIKGSDLSLEGNVFAECSKEEAEKFVKGGAEKAEGSDDENKEEWKSRKYSKDVSKLNVPFFLKCATPIRQKSEFRQKV